MAYCSKNVNFEIESDSETEDILSRKCNTSPVVIEKPLSPILHSGIINRKFLIGRRLSHKKSRVRLSNKFAEYKRDEVDKDKSLVAVAVNETHPLLIDDSFASSSDLCLLNRINRLEKFEKDKQNIYKILVTDSKNDDIFKIPISPVPVKTKKNEAIRFTKLRENTKNVEPCSGSENYDYRENKSYIRKIKYITSGKTDDIKPSLISKSDVNVTKLCENNINQLRNKSNIEKNQCSLTQEIYESGISNTQILCAVDNILSSLDSNKAIETESKTNIDDFRGFEEGEISESDKYLQQFISLYKHFGDFTNTSNKNKFAKGSMFSVTYSFHAKKENRQFNEIKSVNDSKYVVEDVLFPPKTRLKISNEMKPLVKDIEYKTKCLTANNKRNSTSSFDGFSNASAKRIKLSEESLKETENIFNDLNFESSTIVDCKNTRRQSNISTTMDKSYTDNGFCSASGKSIQISEDSLKKARNIFDDLSLNTFKENFYINTSKSKSGQISPSNQAVTKCTGREETEVENLNKIVISHMENKRAKIENAHISISNAEHSIDVYDKSYSRNGFSSASGKSIKISDDSLRKAGNIFNDLSLDPFKENFDISTSKSKSGQIPPRNQADKFQAVTKYTGREETEVENLNEIVISHVENKCAKIENAHISISNNERSIDIHDKSYSRNGFCSASGKSIKISEDSLRKAENVFDDLSLDPFKENLNNCVSKINIVQTPQITKAEKFQDIFKYRAKEETEAKGENKYAKIEKVHIGVSNDGSKHSINVSKLNIDLNSFHSPLTQHKTNTYVSTSMGFQAAQTEYMKIAKGTLKDQKSSNNEQDGRTIVTPTKTNILMKCNTRIDNVNSKSCKRRLGISSCKQIQISENTLNKTKLIFEDDYSSKSPGKSQLNNIYNSTPVRNNSSCSTPIRNDVLRPSKSFASFLDSINITPIKINNSDNHIDSSLISNTMITLTPPTKGNLADSLSELEIEKRRLLKRLSLLSERQKVLESFKEEKLDVNKRPKTGVLYQSKSTTNRISLVSFVNHHYPGDENHNMDTLSINPHNAENVHFKEQFSASITTKDGAVVVPNIKDIIGLYEIENAFKAMSGVDPDLLPKGWVINHYKWIVWKLASYENMFPMKFKGCLNVDNVIQQLKYRYDREIDKAERSALRKIYEKDDVPQKRMVLCVSSIKTIGFKKFELELCDGWYGIRTILDDPLCNQVARGKIKVGSKLMITGAQLLDCEGCHPLEATDLTCLRINFNCTRRAIWYVKLGYQKFAGPFLIPLHSVDPLGGLIGCIKVYIARVYPFKYLEKIENRSVWLNQKAEEIRAQKWENDRCKKIEEMQENLADAYEIGNTSLETKYHTNISGISCPKTLYQIIQNSSDPEYVQQNLSASQQQAVLDYHHNQSIHKQQQMSEKLSEDVNKLKLHKRDVVAVLKLRIVDVNSSPGTAFNLFIWRPTETHTQVLKEGTTVIVENVLPRIYGDLNTTTKTVFKPQSANSNFINTFKRRLVRIEEFTDTKLLPNFNEFDIVGIVVEIKIETDKQEVWIADSMGRLLLINMYEGPSTCLLPENLKRSEVIAICNLTYRGFSKDIVQAYANHFTVFSRYSQHKHLQDGLIMLKNELPEDMEDLLKTCDSSIEVFRIDNLDIRNSMFDDNDEDTLVSSRITATDIALSLIDINKFT